MQRRVGNLSVESIVAESDKFAAPIVFVHGLWCTAVVWRRFMGYLAHRGWTCHAMNLRGHGASDGVDRAEVTLAEDVSDVQRVIAACEAAPVVIGHDLGGLIALSVVPETVRAVVAVSPLLPPSLSGAMNSAVSGWRARWATYRRRPLPPPRGRMAARYFGDDLPGGATTDSARVARELRRGAVTLPSREGRPALLLAGTRDEFSQAAAVERLAHTIGAQFQTAAGAGHPIPWAPGWEVHVAAIHRWLIHSLGEDLLLLHGEHDE